MSRETEYVSFLVRLWRAPAEDRQWLAQAEHIPSGEQRYFASLEELFEFIRALAGGESFAPGAENARED
ncbi:MAG: hypothetical protein D6770_09420 [Anaerolineae bacterium]|nr:MAG: hypothetical protein D6770_09420 [Anaerolineae bacterium]